VPDTEKGQEPTSLQLRKSREKNKNVLFAQSWELRDYLKEYGNAKNAEKNLLMILIT